jgi:hypothetical protein
MVLRIVLRKLIQSRVARKILAAVLTIIAAELGDVGSYSRNSYGSGRPYDVGAHSDWN